MKDRNCAQVTDIVRETATLTRHIGSGVRWRGSAKYNVGVRDSKAQVGGCNTTVPTKKTKIGKKKKTQTDRLLLAIKGGAYFVDRRSKESDLGQ